MSINFELHLWTCSAYAAVHVHNCNSKLIYINICKKKSVARMTYQETYICYSELMLIISQISCSIMMCWRVDYIFQCINNLNRMQNINSSLQLPDKTLQFVKDHPLLEDPVLPIGNGPRLITKDINYTQIAVQRVQALDGNIHDVIFTGTGGSECQSIESIQYLYWFYSFIY